MYAGKTPENRSDTAASYSLKRMANHKPAPGLNNSGSGLTTPAELHEMANQSPQVKQLKAYQEMANQSPQVKELKGYQAMADSCSMQPLKPLLETESSNLTSDGNAAASTVVLQGKADNHYHSPTGEKEKSTETNIPGEGVLQGIFIYSFEHGDIHAVKKDASHYESLGFKPYRSEDGHPVLANPRNQALVEASHVSDDAFWRQYQIARAKIKDNKLNAQEHEIRDKDNGLSFIKSDVFYIDRLIVQPLGVGQEQAVFTYGTEFCIGEGGSLGAPGEIIEVTKEMVNKYWETPKPTDTERNDPQGSFSPSLGYVRHSSLGPDERYNCIAYALGRDRWVDPIEELPAILERSYQKIEDHSQMLIGADYICVTRTHAWRAKKIKDGLYHISEKNGTSAVYDRDLDQTEWQGLMDKYASTRIYRAK